MLIGLKSGVADKPVLVVIFLSRGGPVGAATSRNFWNAMTEQATTFSSAYNTCFFWPQLIAMTIDYPIVFIRLAILTR